MLLWGRWRRDWSLEAVSRRARGPYFRLWPALRLKLRVRSLRLHGLWVCRLDASRADAAADTASVGLVVLPASFCLCLDLRVLVKAEVLDAAGLGNAVWIRFPILTTWWRVWKPGVEAERIALWDEMSASASDPASRLSPTRGVAVASLPGWRPPAPSEATATLPDMWRRSYTRGLTVAKSWHAAWYCDADDGAEAERGSCCCGVVGVMLKNQRRRFM